MAAIACVDGSERPARIRNIAAGGLAADMAKPVEAGERVVVILKDHGSLAGHVVWREGRQVGIAFDNYIETDAVLPREIPAERWEPLPMHRVTSDRSNRVAIRGW